MARADVFADLFGGLMLSGIRLVLLLHNVHRFVCLWWASDRLHTQLLLELY